MADPKEGMSVSRPLKVPKPVEIYEGRITLDYLVQQHEYTVSRDSFQERRTRLEENDSLYKGLISDIFPDETALSDKGLYIENKFKNSLHDHARLSAEGRGMPKFIERGDREEDKIGARVRESVTDTYWVVGHGKRIQRPLYLDLGGTGAMAIAAYYDRASIYPKYMRLNPRYCYPDYRNGDLRSMVYIETMYERVAASEFPNIGLNKDAKSNETVDLIAYYDTEEVVEAFVRRGHKRIEGDMGVYLVQRWVHSLGIVPVAYHQIATFDGAIRGLFDQLAGPMMVRNKAVRFAIDYMEQAAYSPLFAMNILNADEKPGPLTVYKGDPDAEPGTVHLERVGPASTGQTIWQLVAYMGAQEELEAVQPATRTGPPRQSQASGSFVNATQGTLTSVIIEMQDGMADLREQLNTICMQIDEKWLDVAKPLVKAVGKKKTYKPSKDIGGWYYHTIEFGAGAGLDKLNTDNRILNLIAGRLLDRGTGMEQIDFVDDSTTIQEKIDAENIADAMLQRFATDPTTPFATLVQATVIMKRDGKTLTEALFELVPELMAQEKAKQDAENGVTPPTGEIPEGAGPEAQPATAEGALPAEGAGETPVPTMPSAPMMQLFGPVR